MWLGVISGGFQLWGSWSAWSFGGLAAPLLVLAGIVGFAAVWLVGSPRSTVIQVSALAAVVASTLGNEGVGIHARRFYSTDSAAFNQAGARLLMHGTDPYTVTLGSLASLLKVPAQFWTYTVSGGHVDHVSYPAGSILLQMPALLLGFHHEVVDWMDLLAWIVTGVIIFVLLPTSIRWIAPSSSWLPPSPGCSARGAPMPPSCPSWCSPSGAGTDSASAGPPVSPGGWARWPSASPVRSSRPRGSASPSSPWGSSSRHGGRAAARCGRWCRTWPSSPACSPS